MEKLKFKDLKIGDTITALHDKGWCYLYYHSLHEDGYYKRFKPQEGEKVAFATWKMGERFFNDMVDKGHLLPDNRNKSTFTHKDVEVGDTIIIKGYESFSVQKTGGNTKPYFLINSKTGWYSSGGILDIYFQKGEAKLIKNKEKANNCPFNVKMLEEQLHTIRSKDLEALNNSILDKWKLEEGLITFIGQKLHKTIADRILEINKKFLATGGGMKPLAPIGLEEEWWSGSAYLGSFLNGGVEVIEPPARKQSAGYFLPCTDPYSPDKYGFSEGPAPATKDVGSKRSNADNKPRVHDFLPYTRLRFGYHMLKGSFQNGIRNFSTGYSKEMTEDRIIAGIHRHITAWEAGDRDEDNLSAIIFGAQQLMIEEEKKGIKPDHYFKPKTDKS